MYVVFYELRLGQLIEHRAPDFTDLPVTDAMLAAARDQVEAAIGRPLAINPMTSFPDFIIFDSAGNEVGGG
jgi:hypothetical protein